MPKGTKKSKKLRRSSSQLSMGSDASGASSRRSSASAANPAASPSPEATPAADDAKDSSATADAAAAAPATPAVAEPIAVDPAEQLLDFLAGIGLDSKRDVFVDAGYNDVKSLQELSEDHLEDLALDCDCGESEYLALKVGLDEWDPSGGALVTIEESPTKKAKKPAGPPPPLDAAQVEQLKKLFIKWDPDANGSLTPEQLRSGLKKVASKLGAKIIETIVSDADQDGDGTIDYDEFVEVMEVMLKASQPEPESEEEEEEEDPDAPLKISDLRAPWKPENWAKIKVAGKIVAAGAKERGKEQGKKAVYRAIGKKMVAVKKDDDWPEWKQKTLVDAGESVDEQVRFNIQNDDSSTESDDSSIETDDFVLTK